MPDLLDFSYGTRAERKKELEYRYRSLSKLRNQRGRSRKRKTSSFQVQGNAEVKASVWNNVNLLRNSGNRRNERLLKFFEPNPKAAGEDPYIIMPTEVVDREAKKWERCLVAYVVGKRPAFPALKYSLELQWRLKAPFQMHSLPEGFFLFNFLDNSDRIKVLEEGPWCFYGRPLVIKEWKHGLVLENDQFNTLPIWVRLPDLDFRLWDIEAISRITSVVGNPKFVDEPTANKVRLKFARACVEITPNCNFPKSINILVGLKWIVQQIHYEWRPLACRSCDSFDHNGDHCPKSIPLESGDLGDDNQGVWKHVESRKNAGKKPSSAGMSPGKSSQEFSNSKRSAEGTSSERLEKNSNKFALLQQDDSTSPVDESLEKEKPADVDDDLSPKEDARGTQIPDDPSFVLETEDDSESDGPEHGHFLHVEYRIEQTRDGLAVGVCQQEVLVQIEDSGDKITTVGVREEDEGLVQISDQSMDPARKKSLGRDIVIEELEREFPPGFHTPYR